MNPILAYQLTIGCALVVGGFFMERLALQFAPSKTAALLTGVVYIAAPYYVVLANQLGNLTETIALGILPMVLYYTLQQFRFPHHYKTALPMAISWYFLITTHLITFIYSSIFIALWLLFMCIQNFSRIKNLLLVGLIYFFSCCLAMWYLAPIALLEKFFPLSSSYHTANSIFFYHATLRELFFGVAHLSNKTKGAFVKLHPAIGWPIILASIVCLYAIITNKKSKNNDFDNMLPYLFCLFVISLLLVWSPFNFWRWLPHYFFIGQYCWRFLQQLIWIGSLLFAWALCWVFKNKLDFKHLIAGTIFILINATLWFAPLGDATTKVDTFINHPTLNYNRNAYLIDPKKYTGFYHATVHGQTHWVKLPVLFYPQLLRITVNDVPVSYEGFLEKNRLLTIIKPVPHAKNIIHVRFAGIAWANTISWIVWCLLGFVIFYALGICIASQPPPNA